MQKPREPPQESVTHRREAMSQQTHDELCPPHLKGTDHWVPELLHKRSLKVDVSTAVARSLTRSKQPRLARETNDTTLMHLKSTNLRVAIHMI